MKERPVQKDDRSEEERVSVPDWCEPLLEDMGVGKTTPIEETFRVADTYSNKSAPNVRTTWSWVLLLECLAVIAPILWLLAYRLEVTSIYIGYAVVAACAGTLGTCWWYRWRGTQHSWTRSRLLAEIARSRMTSSPLSADATHGALEVAPSIQGLVGRLGPVPACSEEMGWNERKRAYLAGRIDAQIEYYDTQSRSAEASRRRLSRWVTRGLDGALFLAVAGLMIALSSGSDHWMRLSGSDIVLAVTGSALPLIALFCQSLNSYLGLDRRRGRYLQQLEFLRKARWRLEFSDDQQKDMAIVEQTERSLLSLVALGNTF